MLSLDNPELVAMLKHPPAPAPILVDWLQEHDADEEDMVVLTAGTPPYHQDGLPLVDGWGPRALSLWLERQGQTQQARLVNRHNHGIVVRSNDSIFNAVAVAFPPDPGNPLRVEMEFFWGDEQEAAPRARRAIKRKILSLPWAKDVRVERRAELCQLEYPVVPIPSSIPWLAGWLGVLGFRLDLDRFLNTPGPARIVRTDDRLCRRWVYTQTLTAPQLIWPEPRRGHVPGAALNPDAFREPEAVLAHVGYLDR